MQNIVLDDIKLPTGEEKDATRFRQIQQERINRNFRRLLEITVEAGLGTEYKQVIEELQSDVSDMQETIATQADTISTLSSTVAGHTTALNNIGTRLTTNPSAVSVAASTWKTVASLAFTAGTWVVFGTVQWASNSTGRRRAILSTSQDSSDNYSLMTSMEIKALNDGSANTYVNFASVVSFTSSQTLYMNAWQNSGGALSTTGRFYAVRIA